MPQVPLLGGFYKARSLKANAQRIVNLYPEPNPEDADAPVTCYPTPGLTKLVDGTDAPVKVAEVRGLYLATNNQLFAVIGNTVFTISQSWVKASIGTISSSFGLVSMQDNGIDLFIVDGSTSGWTVDLATNTLTTVTDSNFVGSKQVAYQDTFLLFSQPSSKIFYHSESNGVAFSAGAIASKTAYPDNINAMATMRREWWLLGSQANSEIWYNAGNAGFAFEIVPGAYVEHGCLATFSLAKSSLALHWLGTTQYGGPVVVTGRDYRSETISTFAIGNELAQYSVLDDAIGMVYQQGDHTFYMLTFPTEDVTWCYDTITRLWHQRAWTDDNGEEHRHRANCMTQAYGKIVVGDWENGNIYHFDLDNYTDDNNPIVRRRTFPHIVGGAQIWKHNVFTANMDVGNQISGLTDPPPTASLHWSDDGGHSYGTPVDLSLGGVGKYITAPSVRRLGIARDRVYEVFWDDPAFTAISGAWVEVTPALNMSE